jgi:hypothetical protein
VPVLVDLQDKDGVLEVDDEIVLDDLVLLVAVDGD